MQQQKERLALVSMTNKDVYYVTKQVAKELMDMIAKPSVPAFFETVDAKSGSQIAIATKNISSVVIPEGVQWVEGGRRG